VCKDAIAKLTCNSNTAAIETAQAVTCVNDSTGDPDTCACNGWGPNSLSGGGDFDPVNNANFSNCIAKKVSAVASAHTGRYENVFIEALVGGSDDGFYVENDIIDSIICSIRVRGSTSAMEFRSGTTFRNTTFNYVAVQADGGLKVRAKTTFTNVDFGFLNIFEDLQFDPDESGGGGNITLTDVQFNFLIIGSSCIVDPLVTVNVDSLSDKVSMTYPFGSNTCPTPLFDPQA
jgi:hypothetical protein